MQERKVRSQGNSQTHVQYEVMPISHFKVEAFKILPCQINHPAEERKLCPYYHDETDRRRDPLKFDYKCQMCPSENQCSEKDYCAYSHNKVEQVYHQNRYKTKYCKARNQCVYGQCCSFAHNDDELRLPQKLHTMNQDFYFWTQCYKTVWCPYTQNHDRGNCKYAHNAQDFRRHPINYKPQECSKWNKKSQQIQQYDQGGCPDLMDCQFCHGWKEYEYHPQVYKTKQCTTQNCAKDCAYYHHEAERQYPGQREKTTLNKPKNGSQFNGPIKSNYVPPELKTQFENKLELGAPLELFSVPSSYTITKASESRKMSDLSDGFHRQYQKQPEQRQYKKNRTAPVTPDVKYQKPILFNTSFTKNFQQNLKKQNEQEALQILFILEGLKVEEKLLMNMKDEEFYKLNLSPLHIKILINTVHDLKVDCQDDELIKLCNPVQE